jgi:hypothetical protein
MEMARRSAIVSLILSTENSLLCTSRDLFADRIPTPITKVSELSITDGAKRDLTGSAFSRPLMNSIQLQPALTRRNSLRTFLMNVPLMSPAEKRCWSHDSFSSENTPCASL